MSTEPKTVAGAYAKIESHEDVCAVRYAAIETTLGELKAGQKAHAKAAWGVVLALCAWMGLQLWSGVPHAQAAPVVAAASK